MISIGKQHYHQRVISKPYIFINNSNHEEPSFAKHLDNARPGQIISERQYVENKMQKQLPEVISHFEFVLQHNYSMGTYSEEILVCIISL